MSEIALAWTFADACPPEPMRLQGSGPVRPLTAPRHRGDTPRQRLALLQLCFDAGMDMVPLSADQPIPASQALPIPANILPQLNILRGLGQLTLTLTWRVQRADASEGSGRSWLQMRQRLLTKAEEEAQMAKDLLASLVAKRPSDSVVTQSGPGHCRLDLLVPRSALSTTLLEISVQNHISASRPLPGASLLVTGLWPPFSFVRAQTHEPVAV